MPELSFMHVTTQSPSNRDEFLLTTANDLLEPSRENG